MRRAVLNSSCRFGNCGRSFALRRNDTFCRNHICSRPIGRVRAWICRSRIYVPSTASSRETTTRVPPLETRSPKPPTSMCRAVSRVIRFRFIGGIGRPSPRLGSSASETAFTHLQRFPCDARRSRIGRRNNTTMLTELTKLAVASTAATVVVWLLSLIHSGCVPDHVGDLIRFAAC